MRTAYPLVSMRTLKILRTFEYPRRTITSRGTLFYGDNVASAKKNHQPIIALESTIITHGMPYPHNLNTALRVEDIIRTQGATPATIGIIDGKIHVGLSREQLEILAKVDPAKTLKCSRRDLSFVISQKLNGGTTVSATILIAHLAGLSIMATGGIGGVHRSVETTWDISADLVELGRTPVAVVCSGVKSILDIGKTLEFLETQGVPVVKIGESDKFPAFYCVQTFDKIRAPHNVADPMGAANIIKAQRKLGLNTGILFAVSIPEKHALCPDDMESAIRTALESAKSMNVTGKNVTPFLLQELNKVTHGQSLYSNMALIENNAKVAAEISLNLYAEEEIAGPKRIPVALETSKRNPVVIGGAIFDTILQVKDAEIKCDGRTHNAQSQESCGGVGRNIANALINLGLDDTLLISVVGNDDPGKAIIKNLGKSGRTVVQLPNVKTARYTATVDRHGECYFATGEMEAFAAIDPSLIRKHESYVKRSSLIILDGNPPLNTIRCVMDIAVQYSIPVWYEPTDIGKATKIFQVGAQWQESLHFISPNRNELLAIAQFFNIKVGESTRLEEIRAITEQLAEHIPIIITTLGSEGALITRRGSADKPFYNEKGQLITSTSIESRLYTPLQHLIEHSKEKLNVNGCGDCLNAGLIYGIYKGLNEKSCLSIALQAATLALKSFDAVPSTLFTLREVMD